MVLRHGPRAQHGQTNPLNDKDLEEFVALEKTKSETEKSWSIDVKDIDTSTYDLSVKNPNAPEEAPLRAPEEILEEMVALDAETKDILQSIKHLLK